MSKSDTGSAGRKPGDVAGSLRARLLEDVQDKRLELPTLPESNARIELITDAEDVAA